MKRTLRNIFAFFLLLTSSLPFLFTAFFLCGRQIIRDEMKEKLETSLLHTVMINEKDVVWMDDHEIWINEHMFDVHSKKLENGIYTFTGLYDEQETKLVKKYINATEKNNEEDQLLSRLFICLQNVFYSEAPVYSGFITKPAHSTTFLTPALAKPFRDLLTPPPQV